MRRSLFFLQIHIEPKISLIMFTANLFSLSSSQFFYRLMQSISKFTRSAPHANCLIHNTIFSPGKIAANMFTTDSFLDNVQSIDRRICLNRYRIDAQWTSMNNFRRKMNSCNWTVCAQETQWWSSGFFFFRCDTLIKSGLIAQRGCASVKWKAVLSMFFSFSLSGFALCMLRLPYKSIHALICVHRFVAVLDH